MASGGGPINSRRARAHLARFGERLNFLVERVIAVLMAVLVVDVWLGVTARYVFHAQIPWTEELARYLMIWAVLLAISCGIARREHIGILTLLRMAPKFAQSGLLLAFDVIAVAFFGVLLWFGLGLVETGAKQFSMIFGMSMAPPYAAVPVCAGLSLIQLLVVSVRDFGAMHGAEREKSV